LLKRHVLKRCIYGVDLKPKQGPQRPPPSIRFSRLSARKSRTPFQRSGLDTDRTWLGLSIAKFEALSVVVSQDRPISLSELAEKLTCVRSNVTQLVDRLEADGLVKRADDPADRRAVRAEVTALGRKRHAAGAKVVHAVLQEVAKELSAVDPLVLKRALDAVQ
jgi:DNA-binding MarR family transcriptional regulator